MPKFTLKAFIHVQVPTMFVYDIGREQFLLAKSFALLVRLLVFAKLEDQLIADGTCNFEGWDELMTA